MEHGGRMNDEHVVFVALEDDCQGSGARIGDSADAKRGFAGVKLVGSIASEGVEEVCVVGTVIGPMSSVSVVIAD